jgi:hypothetical protein
MDHPQQQHRQRDVKERQGPEVDGFRASNMYPPEAEDVAPAHESPEEVRVPGELWQGDRQDHHTGQERALEPECDRGDEQGDVREPQEVLRPPANSVHRHEHAEEQRVANLDPERDELVCHW